MPRYDCETTEKVKGKRNFKLIRRESLCYDESKKTKYAVSKGGVRHEYVGSGQNLYEQKSAGRNECGTHAGRKRTASGNQPAAGRHRHAGAKGSILEKRAGLFHKSV